MGKVMAANLGARERCHLNGISFQYLVVLRESKRSRTGYTTMKRETIYAMANVARERP